MRSGNFTPAHPLYPYSSFVQCPCSIFCDSVTLIYACIIIIMITAALINFGMWDCVLDVINRAKFQLHRLRNFGAPGGQKLLSPILTRGIATKIFNTAGRKRP